MLLNVLIIETIHDEDAYESLNNNQSYKNYASALIGHDFITCYA